jgi:hypothetical protein
VDIAAASPEEVTESLRPRPHLSRVALVATIVAVLTCWVPYLGVVTSGGALFLSYGTRGPAGCWSAFSTSVAVIVTGSMIFIFHT